MDSTNQITNSPKRGLDQLALNAFLNSTINAIQDPEGLGIFCITHYQVANTIHGETLRTWVIETDLYAQTKLLEDDSNYLTYWDKPIKQLQDSIYAELDSYPDLIRHNLDEITLYKVADGGYTIAIYYTDSGLIITQAETEM